MLRTDDRGQGKSKNIPAGADLNVEASDVVSSLAYLAGQPKIDAKRIGLVGHSSGGVIASMVTSGDSRVAFLALLSSPGVPEKN